MESSVILGARITMGVSEVISWDNASDQATASAKTLLTRQIAFEPLPASVLLNEFAGLKRFAMPLSAG